MNIPAILKRDVRDILWRGDNKIKAAPRTFAEARNRPNLNAHAYSTALSVGAFLDFLQRSRVTNWGSVAGKEDENSLIAICQGYMAMSGTQAPLVTQILKENEWATWNDYAPRTLPAILDHPCPMLDISRSDLIGATLIDVSRGNAYWLIVEDMQGRPIELWWAHRDWVEVELKANTTTDVVEPHYRITWPGGSIETYPARDIIHFRRPVRDPDNWLLGLDPAVAQRPYVAADNEAGQYSYGVLNRMGVMPMYLKINDRQVMLDDAAKEGLRESVRGQTTGGNRAGIPIFDEDIDVKEFGATPEKMALDKITDPPEERIPALFGLNPIALGLGAGLKTSSYNNATEAKRSAWDNGIAPTLNVIQSKLNEKLVPRFVGVPGMPQGKVRLWFEYKDIPALQEDENEMHKRAREDFTAGGVKVNQYLIDIRKTPFPDDDPRGEMTCDELRAYAQSGMLPGAPAANAALPAGDAANAPDAGIATTQTLNGAQITAAVEVINQYNAGTVGRVAAIELLVATGIPRDRAEAMINESAKPLPPDDPAPAPTDSAKAQAKALPGAQFKKTTPTPAQQQTIADFLSRIDGATAREKSDAIIRLAKSAEWDLMDAANALQRGEISVAQWAERGREAKRTVHYAQAVLGYGGPDAMTDERWAWAIEREAFHDGKWSEFEADVKAGRYDKPDGEDGDRLSAGFLDRNTKYATSSHGTFENALLEADKQAGRAKYARRIRAAVDSCASCIEYEERGIVLIDEVVEIGDECLCGGSCQCVIVTAENREDLE